MLEQGAKVMSAIHKRLYYGLKEEFFLLAHVFGEFLPEEYPYNVVGAERTIKAEDFDDRVDIIPVADPNIFSMAQRVTLAQTELQLAQSAPDLHNMYEAYRRMYKALGVRDVDTILKPMEQGDAVPKDPAAENADSLENIPLEAFEGQNHDAHIMAHLVFGSSGMVGQLPQTVMALQKHVMDHIALKSREQVMAQMGPQMQQMQGQEMPPEQFMQIEAMVADLISQGMQEVKQVSAQLMGQGQEDPLIALKAQDLEIKARKDQQDTNIDLQRLELDKQKSANTVTLGNKRIQSNEGIVDARIDAAREREIMKLRSK